MIPLAIVMNNHLGRAPAVLPLRRNDKQVTFFLASASLYSRILINASEDRTELLVAYFGRIDGVELRHQLDSFGSRKVLELLLGNVSLDVLKACGELYRIDQQIVVIVIHIAGRQAISLFEFSRRTGPESGRAFQQIGNRGLGQLELFADRRLSLLGRWKPVDQFERVFQAHFVDGQILLQFIINLHIANSLARGIAQKQIHFEFSTSSQ